MALLSNKRNDFFYLWLFYHSIIIPIVKIVFAHMFLSYESTRVLHARSSTELRTEN